MKNYKIIGLTGQSGAGKSTVASMIGGDGICVINADKIVSELYASGSACLKSVAAAFGSDILNSDGTVNRPVLAQRAFSSRENTALLNSIVHPFVVAEFLKRTAAAVKDGADVIVFDAPQLFECSADVVCDLIISVVAPAKVRIDRICKRDKISADMAEQRINAQLDEEFFRKNSDYVIENDADVSKAEKQLKEIFSNLG